jgi:AraC family transcriptional regulator of adaptative response/methylated-DNA-[protein]-cysteine methyltransferase
MATMALAPQASTAAAATLARTTDANEHWRAVVQRDGNFDGVLYYAVRSTKIYCRPSCPSRRPKPENVRFYFAPEEAEHAGFRACKRCRPRTARAADPQIEHVRRICRHIEENLESSLTLEELSGVIALSPHHLQRTFKQVTGVSPHDYIAARRSATFKAALRFGHDVTSAIYEAGYTSPSRVYENSNERLGMTPAQYRRGAEQVSVRFAVVPCSLGQLLVAATEKGICAVKLGDSPQRLEAELRGEFSRAEITADSRHIDGLTRAVLDLVECRPCSRDLPVDVKRTAFQERVYQELRRIPRGETRTYTEIAAKLGDEKKRRAVARACATNQVALVIPCHRVVRGDGGLGGYRWGIERKRELLARERK